MSVLLETSRGDIVVDLYVEDCPKATLNFLKLCKIKYYNNCLFHNVQTNFIIQSGDPEGTGTGGSSIYGVMYGEQARFFEDEIRPHLKHKKRGMIGMAGSGENCNGSQFYITTGEELDSLDDKRTIFGEVAEGMDVVMRIDEAYCDDNGRPFQNIRIRHTYVLDDPFDDPPLLKEFVPDASPQSIVQTDDRLEDDWVPEEETRPAEEIEQMVRRREAHNRAVVLEMIGDIPEAEVKPPSNMLFVCKLNPVTTEEDLEIIFARFGTVASCDIIRDWKTGDSLCYAFIGFDTDEASEEAYFKMNNVLIDDRRIKVDFSQSVYHLWRQYRRFGKLGKQEDNLTSVDHGQSNIETKTIDDRRRGDYRLLLDEKRLERGALKRRSSERDERRRSPDRRDNRRRDRSNEDRSQRRRDSGDNRWKRRHREDTGRRYRNRPPTEEPSKRKHADDDARRYGRRQKH